jgi:uncharacterized protein YkwD
MRQDERTARAARALSWLAGALASSVLAGCGGGVDTTPASAPAPAGQTSASAAAQPATPTALAETTSTPALSATAAKSFADQTLEAVNAARAVARNCGTTAFAAAGPLKWQAQTEQAALVQAQYLQQNNLFSHTGANGSTVGDRLTATGYAWSTVGENIAAGYGDLAGVVKGWLDSPGHCVNVMNPNFTDLGVALVQGTSSNTYRTYWGMVLARPR